MKRLIVLFLTIIALDQAHAQQETATIIGRIELAPNVPCTNFTCSIEGTALTGTFTNSDGIFELQKVPSGRWNVVFTSSDTNIPPKRIRVGVDSAGNADKTLDLGVIQIAIPGFVCGYIDYNPHDALMMVVAAPEQGLAVQANSRGYFVLAGVAPGVRTIRVLTPLDGKMDKQVTVKPGAYSRVTFPYDFAPLVNPHNP